MVIHMVYQEKSRVPGSAGRETGCLGVGDISLSEQLSLFYLNFQNTQMHAESRYRIFLLAENDMVNHRRVLLIILIRKLGTFYRGNYEGA